MRGRRPVRGRGRGATGSVPLGGGVPDGGPGGGGGLGDPAGAGAGDVPEERVQGGVSRRPTGGDAPVGPHGLGGRAAPVDLEYETVVTSPR